MLLIMLKKFVNFNLFVHICDKLMAVSAEVVKDEDVANYVKKVG